MPRPTPLTVRPGNPFLTLRRLARLGSSEFSAAIGVSASALWNAEIGVTRNPDLVLDALGRCGYDADALRRDYETWRAERVDELARRIKPTG